MKTLFGLLIILCFTISQQASAQIALVSSDKNSLGIQGSYILSPNYNTGELTPYYSIKNKVLFKLGGTYGYSRTFENSYYSWLPEIEVHLVAPKQAKKIG